MKDRHRAIPGFRFLGWAAVFGLVMLAGACGEPPSGETTRAAPTAAPLLRNASAHLDSPEDPNSNASSGLIASREPDWPQWRGPRRDGISEETGLLATWPKDGPPLVWKVGNLGLGWSSPIIVGDRLYITGDVDDDLVIFAFDLNGKPQWQTKNGKSWTGPYQGSRACCAYSEGKLYHLNAHGRVACLDAATGGELWVCDLRQQFQASEITWGFAECLLVDGPRLIVTPGGEKALMAALDKQNGQVLWTTEPLAEDRATYASPLLFRHAGRRIVANCSSGHGFGVDADTGKLLWTVPLRNTYGVNVATPIFGNGDIFYVTAYTFGTCYRMRADHAAMRAEKAWSTTLDTCAGAVLLVDGRLYGSGYEKHKGWLCLDWGTGQTRYELKKLKIGGAVYAQGRLYCLAEDGQAALLEPTAGHFQVRGQFQVTPEKARGAWAHPVLLHGRLYLRYHDTLWCYDVRNK